ncbi:MAG: tRNA pseudouridine(38-40) synthase TruA [Chloroflexi bacterium]|nr:tRNA pseudouridine(38-40) synthase TruA [Chloroflexota bacterium]
MHLKKIALVIEYEGTRYYGFQIQAQPQTVQEELEKAVARLTGRRVPVRCASRTDAGVHAKAQVASFRTKANLPLETFVKGLNHYLPEDIKVTSAYAIPSTFDVRTAAIGREYEYHVLNRGAPSPLLRTRAFHVHRPLNLAAMRRGAKVLLALRDFAPFAGNALPKGASTRRRLTKLAITRKGDQVVFTIAGNSFLHQQVRRMIGALLDLGMGKVRLEQFERTAREGKRGSAGPTLPAHGLYLTNVIYRDFPPVREPKEGSKNPARKIRRES